MACAEGNSFGLSLDKINCSLEVYGSLRGVQDGLSCSSKEGLFSKIRSDTTTPIHMSLDSVKILMTFWSLMVQIKAEPGDLEVKPSIYQLLSSDPSKCAP